MKPVEMTLGKGLIKMFSSDSKFIRRTGIVVGFASNLFTWPLQIGDIIINRITGHRNFTDGTFEEGIICIKKYGKNNK